MSKRIDERTGDAIVPAPDVAASGAPGAGTSDHGADPGATPTVIQVPGPKNPVLDRFWEAVQRLPRYVFLTVNLLRDERVPGRAKAALGVGGAYSISPIDLIPGVIPVLGQLDDLVVLLLTLRQVVRSCPPDIAAEHLRRAGLTMDDFDTDLRATRDTAIWLVHVGIRTGVRAVVRGSRHLRSLWHGR